MGRFRTALTVSLLGPRPRPGLNLHSRVASTRGGVAHALLASLSRRGFLIQILIAEDDPDIRSLVQSVVKDLGHAPSCAQNGAEALALHS